MNNIILGEWLNGGPATMDLPRLLSARLLLQAGSGFGKSWALRRLLEQTAGAVQQFIIDPEGEFATLREKHDYVIAAVNGGDALAHPRTAGLLLRRLMETGVSAILDISELKKPERRRFVRLFVEEMMQLPRAMWSPVLTVIDEAHEFAPEKDEAESLSAIVDLATRGRKRGFALVAATQRIGKFSKDVAAELHNKLIGFTSLDIDVKRAAFELGLTPKDANEQLRALKPGDFYAFGPATSQTVQRLRIGKVATTHPEPGTKKFRAPPSPTAAIKAVLSKLADLPKEAEEEARTVEDLRRENAQLKRQLAASGKRTDADIVDAERRGYVRGWTAYAEAISAALATIPREPTDARPENPERSGWPPSRPAEAAIAAPSRNRADGTRARQIDGRASVPVIQHAPDPELGTGGKRRILTALAQYPAGLSKRKLSLLVDISPKGGTWRTYMADLRSHGWVNGRGDHLRITDAGRHALGAFDPLPTGQALIEYWRQRLGDSGKRKIFDAVCAVYPESIRVEDVSRETNISTAGGTWRTYMAELRGLGLIEGRGELRASDDLF